MGPVHHNQRQHYVLSILPDSGIGAKVAVYGCRLVCHFEYNTHMLHIVLTVEALIVLKATESNPSISVMFRYLFNG